jgi:hypothetical protein
LNRRRFLYTLTPAVALTPVAACATVQDMGSYLRATRYVDSKSPAITTAVNDLIAQVSTDRAKAVRIHDFVRDEVKFGLSSSFYDQPASAVLAERVGYCNTKGTLFVAMLRAAGIPARQHFVDINAELLQPLIQPGTAYVDHSFVEVFLQNEWIALDSYIVDKKLLVAAKKKLKERSLVLGYGIHSNGQIDWNGSQPAFSQYLNDGSVARLSTQDHGVHDDVGAFYESGCCNRDLPNESTLARICTFECTFCADCADNKLLNICPNCGGELVRRPIRPAAPLAKYPQSTERVYKPQGCASASQQ